MKLIQLLEKIIDIEPEYIKIENGKMLPNQFPNKVDDFICCGLEKLTSLENCPQQIEGSLNCSNTSITSLEHCPKIVGNSFGCSVTKITSLEYAPLKCKSFFVVEMILNL